MASKLPSTAAGSLAWRGHALADPAAQRRLLESVALPQRFAQAVSAAGAGPLRAETARVLQINVGKFCNQTCRHCHVDAGPDRTEIMPDAVVDACLTAMAALPIGVVDITGGAPELHARFRDLVSEARRLGRHVIHRANLTALLLPAQQGLAAFLASAGVEIIASLPYYLAPQTDAQRGAGIFDRSLEALRQLNALGYGQAQSGLELHLLMNPVGRFLPGDQATLERDWTRELDRRYGICFNNLYTLTNMPIGRYLEYLQDGEGLEAYVHALVRAFNPATLPNLMCRTTISVGWDGRLYDCDFNQMLAIGCAEDAPQTVWDLDATATAGRPIMVGPHCFGCTAGAGSSCGGSLT